MLKDMADYIRNNPDRYFELIKEHIQISALVICIAVFMGVVLAAVTYRNVRINQVLTGMLSILRIIPCLAVLILCIPVLGVGKIPAAVALTLLAIPPVYINAVTAFLNIANDMLVTAEGLGIGKLRTFFMVRLPLSLPTILTGIRICAVEVIASATIASYIGGGGIGDIILTGLNLYRMDLLLLGGLTVAALAVITDLIFVLAERRVTVYKRKSMVDVIIVK